MSRKNSTNSTASVSPRGAERIAARLSPRKQIAFALAVVIGFFALLEGGLWLFGVEPVSADKDPYVGFSSTLPLFVHQSRTDGQRYLTTAPYKLNWFNPTGFFHSKRQDGFRIFSLGGSTTYGRPYTDPLSFSGWLRELLPIADPTRHWEVINAGGISYASYRVIVLMEELLQYEPDLFIVYTGHNEFLERRSYPRLSETPPAVAALAGLASRTRLYAAGQRALGAFASPGTSGKTELTPEVNTILEHSVGPDDYHRDDELRRRVFEHFRYNLNRMVELARSAGVPIMFITPVSNWKDSSPFKSESALPENSEAAKRFHALLDSATLAAGNQDWEQAADLLTEARALDDRHAELQYRLGRALYELDRYEESRSAFSRAAQEDICPLRAPEEIVRIVAEVATQNSVPLIDLAGTVRRRAPHGIPGAEQFVDHVHLNSEGYGLLARQIIDTLVERNVVRLSAAWNEENLESARSRVLARLDRPAYGESLLNLAKVHGWAGKHEEAQRFAQQARDILGDDPETISIFGHSALARGDLETAVAHLSQAVRRRPDLAFAQLDLGTALYLLGRHEEAIPHFTQALEIEPSTYVDGHNNLGLAWQAAGDLERAIVDYELALEADPGHINARNNLGVALLSLGRAAEAREHFTRVLGPRPDDAKARFNLGAAHEAQGDNEEALAQFRESVRLDPDYPQARNSLGLNLLILGRPSEAIEPLERAVALKPDFPEAHDNLGTAHMLAGSAVPASRHLREAARLRPGWAPPLQHLARLLATHPDAAVRDGARAVLLAQQAVGFTGRQDASALEVLAAAYAEAERFPEAAATAQEALALYKSTGDGAAVNELRRHRALYENGQPLRMQ